jgi:hypothetical protein
VLGEFLANCSVLEPCWYRIFGARNKFIPNTEEPSHIPALSKVFGMNDKLSDELLLKCGLLKRYGAEGIRVDKKWWESLRREFQLSDDVEVTAQTHRSLIGEKVQVIRIGSSGTDYFGRKRKADGPPLAIARSSGRKVARDDKRSVNHAAEQMRPAGEKVQPYEVSKLDYKNNST